jgi:FMN-dependent oxidoreductase (nitrilotriacetate monooxygenase family)
MKTSMPRQMHLCGLLIAGPVVHSHALWRNPVRTPDFLSFNYYADIATTLERGKFDLLFFADRLGIADRFGAALELGIRYGDQDATRMDPISLIGALSAITNRIGLGATRSTTYCAPYHVAREFSTLDHISGGRAAWNVVTSMNDGEAMNFGMDTHMEHDARYDRAEEFVELTFKLWDSWAPDALILDRKNGIYADPDKVHYLNHEGVYFRCRGPLNIPSSPQGRPVIIQAGSSGRGKTFAAKWAEVIFNVSPNAEAMRRFTADIRAELSALGKASSSCKVLTAVMPFVGGSAAEAQEKRNKHNELVHPLVGLSTLSAHANVDLSSFDVDQPIEKIDSTGSQGNIAAVTKLAKDRKMSLKDVARVYGQSVMVPQVCGTGAEVAEQLVEMFRSDTSDGFVISPAFLPETFAEFVDEVVPHLQRAGVFRKDYAGYTLREHLTVPAEQPIIKSA